MSTEMSTETSTETSTPLAPLLSAAQDLLSDARDNGECFITEDHDDYDPDNPEKMYADWAALDKAVDAAERFGDAQTHLLVDALREAVGAAEYIMKVCEDDLRKGQSPSPFVKSEPSAALAHCYAATNYVSRVRTVLQAVTDEKPEKLAKLLERKPDELSDDELKALVAEFEKDYDPDRYDLDKLPNTVAGYHNNDIYSQWCAYRTSYINLVVKRGLPRLH